MAITSTSRRIRLYRRRCIPVTLALALASFGPAAMASEGEGVTTVPVLSPISVESDDTGETSFIQTIQVDSFELPALSGAVPMSHGGWHVWFGQRVRWRNNSSEVRYDQGVTVRKEGAGAYKAHVHGTFIKGHAYDGDQVWSSFTNPCASVTANHDVGTCASAYQKTSRGGRWLLVSGHWYDHGANGTRNAKCDGCIDWKFVVP